MRAREFIVEYDRGMTLKSWEQKLTARMANDQSAPETIDEIMEMIESADPTRNKMYAQWIVRRYVAGDYNASDLDQVNLQLTDYDAVKKSLTTGKDINQLTYAQLPDIIQAGKAQKTAPKFEVIPDTEVLYNGPDGQLAIPRTETASRALGSGTAWCTAWTNRDTMFDYYNSSGDIYTWRAKNGNKFQFFWGKDIQFMNSADLPLSPKDMHFYRSINPVTAPIFAREEQKILNSRNANRIIKLMTALNKSSIKLEIPIELLKKNHKIAYHYAKEIIGGRWLTGEAVIASNATSSYKYAKDVIGGRWPKGEAVIASNADVAYKYARSIIKGRWRKGEAVIASNAGVAYKYARSIIKGRWRKGEAVIASNPFVSFIYARDVVKKRWPAGEAAIATSSHASYIYVRDVVKKRWPAGEAAISSDSWSAKIYDQQFGTNLAKQ